MEYNNYITELKSIWLDTCFAAQNIRYDITLYSKLVSNLIIVHVLHKFQTLSCPSTNLY